MTLEGVPSPLIRVLPRVVAATALGEGYLSNLPAGGQHSFWGGADPKQKPHPAQSGTQAGLDPMTLRLRPELTASLGGSLG